MERKGSLTEGGQKGCDRTEFGTRKLLLTVHGDDFTLLGSDEDLDWFEKVIKESLK